MRVLAVDGKGRDDAHGAAAKAFVVARLRQRAIEPGRFDLERVRLGVRFERRVDASGDAPAQREVDAVRRVDDEC